MNFLVPFIYILTFCVGCASILVFGLIYVKFRAPVVRYYTIFIGLMLLWMVQGFYESSLYLSRAPYESLANTGLNLFTYVWGILTVRYFPRFIFAILELPRKTWHTVVSWIFSAILALLPAGILIFFHGDPKMNRYLQNGLEAGWLPVVALTVFYSFALLYRHRKGIRDELKIILVRRIRTLTLVFLPFLIFDFLQPQFWIAWHCMPYGLKFTALYFLIWNLLSFQFVYRYFFPRYDLTPAFELNPAALEKYAISKREKEIIAHLTKGLTLKQIADNLFISYKTVDNHVANIYRKTGAQNRNELMDRIR